MIKSNIYILAFIFFINTAVFCQNIQQDWKKIKLLSTEKATVDKLWGMPQIEKGEYFKYETEDAYILVTYSTEPCVSNKYSRGKFDIPKDTVLSFVVNVKKRISLSEFGFDLELFTKEIISEEAFMASYLHKNEHNKTVFLVDYSGGIENVKAIFVILNNQGVKNLKCSKIYKKS